MIVKYSFILSLFCGSCSYAQKGVDIVQLLNLQEEVQRLEKRICKDIKRNPVLSKESGLEMFHVFWLCCPYNLEKEIFLDHSFLYKLHPLYSTIGFKSILKKPRKLIAVNTFLSDSVGNLITWGNFSSSSGRYTGDRKDYIELTKMLYDKEFDFVFKVLFGNSNIFTFTSTYIALKGDKVYVLKITKDGLEKYSLEEYWELRDKDWFPSLYE